MSGNARAGSYRALLRRPAVARTFALALVGRLAYGMLPLSLFFTIQQATGSFAHAATGMALNGLATLSMPLKARAIDRQGQRRAVPLITASTVVVLGTGSAMAVLDVGVGPAWWALALAVGFASPPLGPSMRAQWRSLVPDGDLGSAYSLDAVCEETLYLVGPMLAAGLLAVAPAYLGLGIAAALLAVGAAGLAVSPVATATTGTSRQRTARGPLRHRFFLGLLLVMGVTGAAIATIYTATAARALAAGQPSYAGIADAAVAVGSVAGGLVWGRHAPAWPWERSVMCLLAFLGTGLALAAAVAPFALFTVALAIGGLAVSPIFVVAYRASDDLVDRTEVTEASTWVNTATNLGIAAGAAASGLLVSQHGARSPGWFGAVLALALAGVIAVASRPRLNARRDVVSAP